jgi:hypothetical protein
MSDFVAKHNSEALAAARDYARGRPWYGRVSDRCAKLLGFHEELCVAYGIAPSILFDPDMTRATGQGEGSYDEERNAISLSGSFSVLTYLHFFAVALETERKGAVRAEDYPRRWSQGLFRKAFPTSWARLVERDAPILGRYA